MASQSVGLGQIQCFIADLHILYPIFSADAGEHTLVIHGAGRLDVGVNFIGHAGHLQEAAALVRHIPGGKLQRIQQLLTGYLQHKDLVAEGMHLHDVVQGNISSGDRGTNAAAVHNGYLCPGLIPIGICAQITQIGFRIADNANRRTVGILGSRIIDGQVHRRLGYHLGKFRIQAVCCGGHRLGHLILNAQKCRSRGAVMPGIQAVRERTVLCGNGHVADTFQLSSASSTDHVLAVLVLHHQLIGIVAVAVHQGINAGGVAEHIRIVIGRRGGFIAQVCNGNHIVGAGFPCIIGCRLHCCVKLLASAVLHEAVNEVALVILEILRGILGQGFRGGNADEANLDPFHFLDHVRRKHQLPVLGKVAADVGELRLLGQVHEVLHTVVVLMVAGNRHIVPYRVHQVNDGTAVGHGAHRLTLDGIAIIHQQHIVGLGKLLLHRIQAGVAKALVNAAVHIAGKQDHHVLGQLRCAFFRHAGHNAQQHGQYHQ